jgi:Tol biopolymer transport system component
MELREQLQTTLAGSYTLERELGGGGMSRVFLATESALGRSIVIKVLPADTGNAVSVERFKREIAVVAKLQHPHIVPILTAGESHGLPFYTMPFVKGDSLRARLSKSGELSVNESMHILRDIASALAYAHAEGVVHRDIKPENVILSGGVAVVTDFGVAKAMDAATTEGGSHHTGLTSLGVALGTPAYMAPEQATADPHVDHRADIYAFGCVAYEMLAGSSPFAGRPMQALLAAHVTETPELLARRRPNIPPALSDLVMSCLEKRPGDRPQTADVLIGALDAIGTPSGGSAPTEARLAAVRSAPKRWPAVLTAAVVAAAVAAWFASRPGTPTLVLGKQDAITTESGLQVFPDISPDGKFVAYASGNFAKMRIQIRPIAGGRTIPLSDDSTAIEVAPKWSPDGTRLLFLVRGGVSIAPALGGSSRALIPPSTTSAVWSAVWSPDGADIAFVRGDSLFRAAADGSSPRFLSGIFDAHSCAWSHDGRWIACVKGNLNFVEIGSAFGNLAPSAIVVVPASGGAPVVVAEGSSANLSPVWAPDGERLFFISNRDGTRDIYAVDVTSSGRARAAPARLTAGLSAISLSFSNDGKRMAYAVYSARSNIWMLPVPANPPASAAAATALTTGNQVIESMSPTPDGRWVLYDSNIRGKSHIFRIPAAGGEPEQLTDGPADEFVPELSPDGRSVVYQSWRNGTRDIEVKPLDGGEIERVTDTPGQEAYARWSPDGRSLAFMDLANAKAYITKREAPGKWSAPRYLADCIVPDWTPDGTLITCVGSITDGAVYVVPASGGNAKALYAPGAREPKAEVSRWSPDGKSILFKTHDPSGRASIWTMPASGGKPQLLVRFDDLNHLSSRQDFASDGKRIYFPMEDRQSNVSVAEVAKK